MAGYDLVTRAEIVRLLYLKNDRQIARYLNVSLKRVQLVRKDHTGLKRKGRPRFDDAAPAMAESRISHRTISAASEAERESARLSSEALLRRQLETGQHCWDAQMCRTIMLSRGWLDVAPTKSAA